jgi:pimeloyl-ACP methyl ester carboxylesterase
MPQIVRRALPWLRIAPRSTYAFGGSMGGQETLLLVARYPRLLAGAAAFDAVTDLALQYRNFPRLSCGPACRAAWGGPIGRALQAAARTEVGATPQAAPRAWALRSPITYARELASSCVPLQMWWSVADKIVVDQLQQSGRLFWELRRLNPTAPVEAWAGNWIHSSEMHERAMLPLALAGFGLLSGDFVADAVRSRAAPEGPCVRPEWR